MSSPAVQLTFTLRTSPNVRTVHLLGSWDGYKNQLPLSAVKDASAKPGSWKGTFRFQGSHALKLGSRYWYYYSVDGYHVSHDPAKEYVVEPTTGRKLNVLDVPKGDSKTPSTRSAAKPMHTSRHSLEIPHGRPVSPDQIRHPKPTKAYASKNIREADYETSPIEQLEDVTDALSRVNLSRHRAPSRYSSDSDSDVSSPSSSGSSGCFSGSYRGSDREMSSPATSVSSGGGCRCERYGVTRHGERVKLDCGGKVCGYESDCSTSSDDESDDGYERERARRVYEAKLREERERNATKNRHAAGRVGTSQVKTSSTRRR